MKRKLRLFLLLSLVCSSIYAQNILKNTYHQLSSPDGKYAFEFYQKEASNGTRQMYYSLQFEGKTVIQESKLGVLIENQLFESALAIPNDTTKVWGENLTFVDSDRSVVDTSWKPVYGERSQVKENYNELVLRLQKGTANRSPIQGDGYDKRSYYHMNVIVRAYDEGIAFRYHFPEATNGLFLHIVGEQTQFSFAEKTQAYYTRWAQTHYELLPLEDWKGESERPLTLKLENGLNVVLAEAEMVDYTRMKYNLVGKNTLQSSLYDCADVITPYSTPWRVIMAANKATDLIANNDIILNLNPANKIADTEWIKPGKVIRITQLNQATALKYVDFAAERKLQYVHLDAGWYGSEVLMSSDATRVSEKRDLDIPALVDYAASKGIGVWVYVNQRALLQQLDEILPLYKKWGIKGIKFGFVQIGNQRWTTWLHDAVRKCAEYEILVDIHDEYRPTGFSRTYPNLLTQEGIAGNEEFPDATHNTILPFTRFIAGAADYTICYYDKRIKTTHAHQLAMAAVYYSPLQFLYWYDQPTAYQHEPEIEFFDNVKTVWDDTKIIDGEIGEFVTIARRSQEEWFLGTLGNNESKNIVTPLTFLDANRKYIAHIYTDDDKVDTKTKVKVTRLLVTDKSVLKFKLQPSGGNAIHFLPASKEDVKKYKQYNKNQIL
ncbi:glycoside hydrolase family 97 protein [Bacteroides propionicifaciens]|uniref:glycoside hydrolase family 97 protein n=1 Tax=Bacteroides propionicifaciens TaxID=392838 RepID=UPI00036958A8|nr:glycoside hydrolase family 97 protein [Bacteroides propionicifaciens]